MPAPTTIVAAQLARQDGLPDAPALLDIRTDEDFAADPRSLPGAVRRDWRTVATWAPDYVGRATVAVCQAGLKLSQGAAAWSRHAGGAVNAARKIPKTWSDPHGMDSFRPPF